MSRWIGLGALLAAAALAACAAHPEAAAPSEEFSQANRAIYQAQQANAKALAGLDMRLAVDKLRRAQGLVQSGDPDDYPEARFLAEEAAVDARVAEARAYLQVTQANVAELRRSINELRQQQSRQKGRTGQ